MKFIFLIGLSAGSFLSYAQNIYGSISGGYQYIFQEAQPPSYIVNSFHQISDPWFWGQEDYSFEQMLTADVSIGYTFAKNFGFEITGTYLKPKSVISNEYLVNKTFSGNFWRINPKLVIIVPFKKLDVYAKIGGLISTGKIEYNQHFQNDGSWNLSNNESTVNYEYTAPVSLGFNASIGFSKRIARNIDIFSELQLTYQSFSPKNGKMTEFKYDNVDKFTQAEYDPYFTEIEFGEESEWYYWNSDDTSKPQKLYNRNYSLSGFDLTIGVKFTIWTKKKREDETP